jgi:hypothetical protein
MFNYILTERELLQISENDFQIASAYKNQVLSGNVANNIGLFFGLYIYDWQSKEALYMEEIVNLLQTTENGLIEEQRLQEALTTALDYMKYVEGAYAAKEDVRNVLFRDFNVTEYNKLKRTITELDSINIEFRSAKNTQDLGNAVKKLSVLNSSVYLSDSISTGFSDSLGKLSSKNTFNLTKFDVLVGVVTSIGSSVDTFFIFNDIYIYENLTSTAYKTLNLAKHNTQDEILISAIDRINSFMTNQTERQKGAFAEAFKKFGMELTNEAVNFAIGMAGPVGVAVSASISLGNFTGISSSAANAMKTCCEAGIADALALSLTQKMNFFATFTSENIPGKWWALYDNTRDGKTERNEVYNQYLFFTTQELMLLKHFQEWVVLFLGSTAIIM